MKTLLRLDCSSRLSGSHSRALADYFEKTWLEANPDGNVILRDLVTDPVSHIQNETIEAFYTPDEFMTHEGKEATALSDKLIAELKSADEVLINSPLYNLNVPSCLKAYLDQVIRIGHTFGMNENGYYGLIEDKIAHLITVKGDFYKGTPMETYDFQEPYLQLILGHMGFDVQNVFTLEGTSRDPELLEERKGKVHEMISSSMIKPVA